MHKLVYVKATVILVASVAIACAMAADGTDGKSVSLMADDPVVVQGGEKIYHAQCAQCHGAELQGQPDWRTRDANGFLPAPPHDASGHTWHHADDQLFEITKYGAAVVIGDATYRTLMPVYKDILTDEQIIAVLSFIKNTWPIEQRSWQEEINGTQQNGLKSVPGNQSTLIEKLLK